MKNRVTGIILLLCSVIVYFNMGIESRADIAQGISESAWPTALLVILALLSIAMILSDLKKNKEKSDIKKMVSGLVSKGSLRLVAGIVVFFIYIFALDVLGFLIATPILLGCLLYLIGFRGAKILIPSPIIVTIAMALLFSTLIHVPLPEGTSIFRAINSLLL